MQNFATVKWQGKYHNILAVQNFTAICPKFSIYLHIKPKNDTDQGWLLQYTTANYTTLNTTHYTSIQHTTLHYNTPHYSIIYYTTLH